jgi:ABC-2 type transport system permease protein
MGASVRRHLELLGSYFAQYVKVRIGYRGDFFLGLGTSMLATAFGFGFLFVLFSRIPRLGGWRLEEAVFLYGFGLIPFGLFNVLSLNIYEFGNSYIIEGKFDRVLLRPVSSLFQVLFEAFRLESLQEVFTGVLAIWWASHRMGFVWTAGDVALVMIYSLSGAAIYISFFMMLSCVSFWFEDRIGVHPPAWNLIAFGRYPLSIYSQWIQFLLSWMIPFAFASFYPSAHLLGHRELRDLAPLAPVVAAVCFAALLLAWNRGLRQYSSTGS